MKNLLHRLLPGLAVLCFWTVSAQTPSPRAPDFLFLIDTSFSMAREKSAVAELLGTAIRTGLNGKMRSGDVFGIWTFNEDVSTNRFTARVWTMEHSATLAEQTAQFLKRQRFQKTTRLDRALAELSPLLKRRKSLTIFLVSDGDSSISGTPFDRSLNLAYREQGPAFRRAKWPLVTTLVAHEGTLMAWALNLGTGQIQIPDFTPAEPAPAAVPIPAVVQESTPKKEAVETRPTVPSSTQVVPRPTAQVEATPPATNTPLPTVTQPSDLPTATATPPQIDSPPNLPSTSPSGAAEPGISKAPLLREPAESEIARGSTVAKEERSSAPSEPATKAPDRESLRDMTALPARADQATLKEPQSATDSLSNASLLNTSESQTIGIVATTTGHSLSSKNFLLAIALFVLAVALLYAYFRTRQPAGQTSLISRSFDRESKEPRQSKRD